MGVVTDQHKTGSTAAIFVMGVSGSGKTTIGQAIARAKNYVFIDADDLHPEINIAKMKAGIPLTDEDRWVWLERIHSKASDHNANGITVVVACSALKRVYRDLLRKDMENRLFIYLKGSFELIHQLLELRKKHFMPAGLLQSQFETLEEPGADEHDCISIPITTLQQELQEIDATIRLRGL